MINTFETVARAQKVLKLASNVPVGATRHANINVAITLRAWPQADRELFAAHFGVRAPSNKTWNMLCDYIATR